MLGMTHQVAEEEEERRGNSDKEEKRSPFPPLIEKTRDNPLYEPAAEATN